MSCNDTPETVYLGDIPIDNLDEVPDYFLTEQDITDETTGNVVRSILRTPSGKILPNGNLDNITTCVTNNTDLDSLEDNEEIDFKTQVMAGYIANEGTTNVMYAADADHNPMFIMRGELTDGTMLIQNTGFAILTAGHEYTVGLSYYLGDDGFPTTDSSVTGWHLFDVVSTTKLAINIYQKEDS